MSWFDAAGLASIAKSALKEAQRTIDKALDIKEETKNVSSDNPVNTNSEDFFGIWGLPHTEDVKKEPLQDLRRENRMDASIWGSFTEDPVDPVPASFNQSKLVADRENPTSTFKIGITDVKQQDVKLISESVEIVSDTLTSGSSVEVIGSYRTNRRQYQHTGEFVSPLDSSSLEQKSSFSFIEKNSPESVEVIPEDQNENSVAEDTMSYTSISESTSTTVLDSAFNLHLKPQKMLKDTYNRPELMNENNTNDLPLSPERNHNFSDPITRAPSRTTMHLPLPQVNQVLIDTQPQAGKQDVGNILENTHIIDIPQEKDIFRISNSETQLDTDESSQSDKTIICNENLMESSSDTSTTTEISSNSTYLKSMLADAMTENSEQNETNILCLSNNSLIHHLNKSNILEGTTASKDMLPRENSPISSESRSDLVKIGSDHTSAHTSGDELETTTSSDIEIISSPNGDSSSTQSRQSPAKQACAKAKSGDTAIGALLCKMTIKKAKGHARELSEASSISDDSHSSEIDRLLKRISEMTDILESRESKLIDVNHRNAQLQELNNDLKLQLDSIITKQLESADLSQVTEEYTQRLSALEKKFQQAIREKDSLRKQLEQVKQEAASRMSKSELEALIFEKDEVIKELREEGEKLSKQQLQHSNIIKKLRAKEKVNESTIKHLKENIDGFVIESDRLKKSLVAKEDVERTQIEAIHQLTIKNKKNDIEIGKLNEQFDDLTHKYDTAKKSLDAAKKELTDKNRTSSELLMREQVLESLENQKRTAELQNEELMNRLEDLRNKLRQSEEEFVKKEQKLYQENNELLRRLEEAETRNEDLSHSVLEVSKPLIRQLESLQVMYNMKVAVFEKSEEELAMRIRELQAKLQTSISVERIAKEECISIRSNLAEIEGGLSTANNKIQLMQMEFEQQETQKQLTEQELMRKIDDLNAIIKRDIGVIKEQEKHIKSLQTVIDLEKSTNELERSMEALENFPNEKHHHQKINLDQIPRTESSSPTLSLGKMSVPDSIGSSFWSQEEPLDVSQTPRYTNMFEMQMLQSNLKQREGEMQQLQWELNRREQERSLLNSEISTLLTKIERLESNTSNYNLLKSQFNELQREYDILCQLYGEKVEENEELKLDLQDVKEMYKSQIDDLLRQQKKNTK